MVIEVPFYQVLNLVRDSPVKDNGKHTTICYRLSVSHPFIFVPSSVLTARGSFFEQPPTSWPVDYSHTYSSPVSSLADTSRKSDISRSSWYYAHGSYLVPYAQI